MLDTCDSQIFISHSCKMQFYLNVETVKTTLGKTAWNLEVISEHKEINSWFLNLPMWEKTLGNSTVFALATQNASSKHDNQVPLVKNNLLNFTASHTLLRIAKFHVKGKEENRMLPKTLTSLQKWRWSGKLGFLSNSQNRRFFVILLYFRDCLLSHRMDFTLEPHTRIFPVRLQPQNWQFSMQGWVPIMYVVYLMELHIDYIKYTVERLERVSVTDWPVVLLL